MTLDNIVCNDLSFGKENRPIPVINNIDNCSLPESFRYIIKPCLTGILLNQSNNLKTSCSCNDRCISRSGTCCSCFNSGLAADYWYDNDGSLKNSNYFDANNIVLTECTPFCLCSSKCPNRVAQNGIKYQLSLQRTKIGWGIFADEDIPKLKFICMYAGEVLTDSSVDTLIDDTYLFDISIEAGSYVESYCIDASRCGNIARFMNHSCNPNASPIKILWDHRDYRCPYVCFFSRSPIQKGDEISCDYGVSFWNVKGHQFECQCGYEFCKYSGEKLRLFLQKNS